MTSIKVGVTGTIHAGKTVFIHDLKAKMEEQGHKTIVVDEVARNCPMPINLNAHFNAELWIALTQITKEIEAENNAKTTITVEDGECVIITDRTMIDNYAFCLSYQIRKRKHDMGVNIIKDLLNYWAHTYNMIFYLKPLPAPIEDDGIRCTDPEWQREIDRIINSTIQHHRLNPGIVQTICTTNNEERVEEAMMHLTPLLKDSKSKKTCYNTSKLVQEQIPVQEVISV